MASEEQAVTLEFEPGTCAGPLALAHLDGIEETYVVKYDPAYIAMLQQCNGGKPIERCFDIPGNTKVITRFLCMIEDVGNDARHGDYDVGVMLAQLTGRTKEGQVPFADLFGGDMLFFVQDDIAAVPRVMVWDHEESDEGAPFFLPVAENFTTFLKMLRVLS